MFKYVVFTLSCLITYNNVCMASKEVLEALLDKNLEPILAQISEANLQLCLLGTCEFDLLLE